MPGWCIHATPLLEARYRCVTDLLAAQTIAAGVPAIHLCEASHNGTVAPAAGGITSAESPAAALPKLA